MWILLCVHIIDIGDTQTCKIYLFNNGFYLCQLTDYLPIINLNSDKILQVHSSSDGTR